MAHTVQICKYYTLSSAAWLRTRSFTDVDILPNPQYYRQTKITNKEVLHRVNKTRETLVTVNSEKKFMLEMSPISIT